MLLAGLRFSLTQQERRLLESYFCVGFVDTNEQGWEETMDLSLTFLLKTSLAKSAKETTTLTSSALEVGIFSFQNCLIVEFILNSRCHPT